MATTTGCSMSEDSLLMTPRSRSLSQELYLMEISTKKMSEKKHNDRLRNCLFINRVYELAWEEDSMQQTLRSRRKRSVDISDQSSKKSRLDTDSSGESTEDEDLFDLSDGEDGLAVDDEKDEGLASPPEMHDQNRMESALE